MTAEATDRAMRTRLPPAEKLVLLHIANAYPEWASPDRQAMAKFASIPLYHAGEILTRLIRDGHVLHRYPEGMKYRGWPRC